MRYWAAAVVAWTWAFAALPQEKTTTTLFVTGDFQGYLSPCGCTSPMSGGIKRLGTLLRTARARSKALLLVNGGLLAPLQGRTAVQVKQDVFKAETLAEALRELDATAINLGTEEASRGVGVISSISRLSGGRAISSSLDPSGTNQVPQTATADSILVGGIAFDSSVLAAATEESPVDPDLAARQLREAAQEQRKTLVILLRGGIDRARALARESGAALIVYTTSGSPPAPEMEGKTLLVSPGDRARSVLRLAFDGSRFSNFAAINLGPEFSDDPETTRLFRRYLSRVDKSNLLSLIQRSHGEQYAGSKACASCHAEAYKIWSHSRHKQAYADLASKGQSRDPDCVSCHVTGLTASTGFRSLLSTPRLADVTCESCHGPAAAHARNPKSVRLAKVGQLSCISCHSSDNSPHFDFSAYWAKIKHH